MASQVRTRVVVHGAAGRMGQRLVALIHEDPDLELAAALESPSHPDLGKDSGSMAGMDANGIPLAVDLDVPANVVIDFSLPEPAMAICKRCVSGQLPLVVATTGLSPEQQTHVAESAQTIPLVWAPNMSKAVNLTMKLATIAARVFKGDAQGADVEIIERHHRFKKDAPSGTALHFGSLIAQEMGQSRHEHGREGLVGARPRDEIGYHALRVGDNPGEHTIVFGLLGETIELTVRATNRDCYALGALAAAKYVANRPAGLYSMYDVLGLSDE